MAMFHRSRRKLKTSISLSLKQNYAPKIKKTKTLADYFKNTMIIIPFMCAFCFLMNIDLSIVYFNMNHSMTSTILNSWSNSFESFKSSLFCPLSSEYAHASTIFKYNNIFSDIYQHQFNHTNCKQIANSKRKYFILSMDDINRNYGFMATINHIYLPPFTLSLFTNRVFLLTANSDEKPYNYLHTNGENVPEMCEKRNGRNCFFKPVSNCNSKQIDSILLHAKQQNNILIIDDASKYCTNSSTLHPNTFAQETEKYNVIYYKVWNIFECDLFDEHGPLDDEKNRGIIETMIMKHNWNINFFQYTAVIFSFFMRLQNNVNNMVINAVNKSLINYKSPQNTMSLIMRGSDKCEGEMLCFTAEQFIRTSKIIIDRNENKLTHMIVTSEDKKMIQYVKNNHNNYNLGVNLIYNDYDDLPNTGNIGKLNDSIRLNEYKSFMFVVNLLMAFKLQMHSDYYIIQRQSNWAHGIWVMTNAFKHCGVYKLQNDYDVADAYDEDKACIDVQGLNKYWNVSVDGKPVHNYDTRRIYWDKKSLNLKENEEFNSSDFKLFLNSRITPDVLHEMYTDYHRCYKKNRFVWD